MQLDDVPREVLAAVAAFTSVCALAAAVRGWSQRLRMRRRFRRGAAGEREASALLQAAGFAIEASQATVTYRLEVDRAPVEVAVRADYIVSRRGEVFVAEVKTGRVAPRLDTSATRRQLLEYQHAFGARGVLLVDADARSIQLVTFPTARREHRSYGIVFAALALAAAALVVFR